MFLYDNQLAHLEVYISSSLHHDGCTLILQYFCWLIYNLAPSKLNLIHPSIKDLVHMDPAHNVSIVIATPCHYMAPCHLIPLRQQYLCSYIMISYLWHVLLLLC